MQKKSNKFFFQISILILVIFTIILSWIFEDYLKVKIKSYLSPEIKKSMQVFFFGKETAQKFEIYKYYNYNQVFLPDTQFQKISYGKFKIFSEKNQRKRKNHLEVINNYQLRFKQYKFFLEIHNNNLIITNSDGTILS